jgi:hypothetical protein
VFILLSTKYTFLYPSSLPFSLPAFLPFSHLASSFFCLLSPHSFILTLQLLQYLPSLFLYISSSDPIPSIFYFYLFIILLFLCCISSYFYMCVSFHSGNTLFRKHNIVYSLFKDPVVIRIMGYSVKRLDDSE